jgi:hypothetical protein
MKGKVFFFVGSPPTILYSKVRRQPTIRAIEQRANFSEFSKTFGGLIRFLADGVSDEQPNNHCVEYTNEQNGTIVQSNIDQSLGFASLQFTYGESYTAECKVRVSLYMGKRKKYISIITW